jgi:hypothetical protein
MSTIQCALYSTFAAKFNLNPRDYAMSNLVTFKSNIITVLLKHASTYNWTYLRCGCGLIDKSMRVILHISCQIKRVSSCYRYVNNGADQIKYSYISCFQASTFKWTYPAEIGEMSTIQCALYSTFAATFSLNPRHYAMSNLVPAKSNIFTVLPMQASTFNRLCLRCDWLFIDKSMRVILHICCQTKRVTSCFRYVNIGPVK